VQRSAHLAGWGPVPPEPGAPSVYDQLLALPNDRVHGERFEYRSILTDLLAWVLERASDTRLPELLSAEIWSQLGPEHDAEITVRQGVCLADGGISMTLRDLARFGEMHRAGGIGNGRRIVPEPWVSDTRNGDRDARAAFGRSDRAAARPGWMYRNQWWVEPDRGVCWALGIHGQVVQVHAPAEVVCVKLSGWPSPWDDALHLLEQRMLNAVAETLAVS
jgi:CubicO group peptidase (beta-lactamase class C family)